MVTRTLTAISLLASLVGCGGSGDSPLSSAHAQAEAKIEVARLHFILRPDNDGRWYIQDDVDHSSIGVLPQIEQTADSLVVYFDRRFTHAGVIQVTSDDDFRDRVGGYCNLGVASTQCRIVAGGRVIDPARVHDYVPPGAGNLWVSVTMINKPSN